MKIHILISPDTPPQFGTNLRALCGVQVPSAQPIAQSDDPVKPGMTIYFCRKCVDGYEEKYHYFSLIVSGEESKQMENES